MELQNYLYLIINITVFAAPLIANIIFKSSELKRFFINFFKTFLIVGIPFIVWDSLVTSRGDWSFNPEYTTGTMFGNIPLEEAMFFFAIPFASLALYELILLLRKDSKLNSKTINKVLHLTIPVLILLAFFTRDLVYSTNIFILTSILVVLITFVKKNNIFHTKNFWIFITISFIPFFIVNTILTAVPIVIYSPLAITDFRVGTIPIEDFFYSFLMLGSYLLTYYILKHQDE